MNFLAHAYLSGNNTSISLGNLLGDMVKGQDWKYYNSEIATGMRLHRYIDEFTDHHPVFIQSKALLKPYFNRYAGVVLDIYFDHFLAYNWVDYHPKALQDYVNNLYISLIKHYPILPAKGKKMIPIMIIRNWLGGYGHLPSLHQIFLGMDRRTNHKGNMYEAVNILQTHFEDLHSDFKLFFPDLITFSETKLTELQNT